MPIVISRVDDRLVHGQVMTSWVRTHNINVIVIVDDVLVNDPLQLNILKLSTPVGVKLFLVNSEKFIRKYQEGVFDKYQVMLIFENVFEVLKLVVAGIPIKLLNIGGIRFKEGRKQYSKAISLSEDERSCVVKLIELGVDIEHRQVQSDQSVNVKEII